METITVKADEPYGHFHKSDSMFLRVDVGSAKVEGVEYELSLNGGNTPLVRNEKTGQWFLLPWSDVLRLALERGL